MLAGDILERVSDKFDKVEVYVEKTKAEEFELRNSKDFSKGLNIDTGCGIRLIKDSKMAFVYTTLDNDNDFDRIINDISHSIKFSKTVDAEMISDNAYNINNEKKVDFDEKKIKDIVYSMDSTAKGFDKRIVDVKGSSVSVFEKQIEIANSNGLYVKDSKTHISASVSVLAKDKIADAGWYSLDADTVDNIDFDYIAKKGASLAVDKLYPKAVSTKKYSIILENSVFVQLLAHFFPVFDAYSVINHTTAFENRMGESVFSDKITIKDSANLKHRPNNMKTDDEGNLRKDVIVVENGVLKNFLSNTYTSNKLKIPNTSNAKRASWMSLPKVGAFNFHIVPDTGMSRTKLMNKIDGLFITEIMGLHMANSISGDFSFGINGFFVHNGELVSYFKAATLADNFFDMMKRVVDVSDEMYFSSSFGSPDVAIADCIVGGENNG